MAAFLLEHQNIVPGKDCSVPGNSKLVIIIITGDQQQEGESQLCVVQHNVIFFKIIIPNVVRSKLQVACCFKLIGYLDLHSLKYKWLSPKLSYQKWLCCNLDSAQFSYLMGERLSAHLLNCHGWVLREYED